ncbi:MAG: hypothetical protein Q7J73_08480 [Dehalococcoidales bacterium]|nr:hypothetical protein [Dehalococcoidales bacterium]
MSVGTGKLWRLAGLLFLLLFLVSCAGTPGQVKAGLGKEFSLAINQTATISGENLKIKLLDIFGDSRCPTGVTCIWAGEVTAVIQIGDTPSTNMTLIEPGHGDGSNQTYNNYHLSFHVQPYPEAGKSIAKEDYRLLLTVDKQK